MEEASQPRFIVICSFLLLTNLFLCVVHSLPAPTIPTLLSLGNNTDRLALLDFKCHITRDPLKTLNMWNDSVHFCNWPGVTCGCRHQRVTILDLRSQGLIGSVSPHIGNLTFLRAIRLQNNGFHGIIPQEVGGLFRLRVINLNNNSLGGEIPVSLCHCFELQNLFLDRNKLLGKIPAELGSLSKLMKLTLAINNLTGRIPPSLGNLSSLQVLAAADNSLEGSIPKELGQLTSLTFLGLGPNRLSGKIPGSLYNLTSIVDLCLPENQLHGSLPPDLGLTLPNLITCILGGNQLSGHIPVSFSNASGLELINLLENNFVGSIPNNLGDLQNLQILMVGYNSLGSGQVNDLNFLTSLTNCTSLRRLGLQQNKFGGELPNSVANLSTQLSVLYLGRNFDLTGSIPTEIGNLFNLTVLGMDYNQITGSIPSSIGRLENLHRLSLQGNKLTGQIPSSLGNITSLYILNLQQNNLNGSIPASLANCRNLRRLDLSRNKLDGTIPQQVLGLSSLSIILFLYHNSLTGFLPPEVGKLNKLMWLDILENKLSGDIPSSLGDCSSLEILNMGENFFEGNIPSSLSSLKAIRVLDLSRNKLSGQIPKAFVKLPVLNLNLSFNYLEGEVPTTGVFGNASAISVTGNNKLCGGTPKLKLHTCSNQELRKGGKSLNLKVIVLIITGVVSCLALVFLVYFLYWKRKPRKSSSSRSSLEDRFLRVSYDGLLKATNGFASVNLIGAGGFGSVYKGILHQFEKIVAVKVLNLQEKGASKSFMAECEALRKIRHRNLIKIITSCSSVDFKGNDFKALVFEFMPNGSLENWLHPNIDLQHESKNLNLIQRLNIAIDVASALDYLHHHCETPIVHCDLKPSNVLLDDDMIAHVGDFGLAKFLSMATSYSSKDHSSSIAIKGSIGYVAPEYGMGSGVSMKGDVYSYGILLLEMVTGKRPFDDIFKDGLNLHTFSKKVLSEQVMEIVDSRLLINELNEATNDIENRRRMRGKMQECLISIVRIGVACSEISPSDRIDMKDVLIELHVIKEVFLGTRIFGEIRNNMQLAGEGTSYLSGY